MIRTLFVRLAITVSHFSTFCANVFEGDKLSVCIPPFVRAMRSNWKYVARKSRK